MTKPSQATLLVALVQEQGVGLWHDRDGRAYITIPKAGHREHHRLRSQAMRSWLSGLAYHQLSISVGTETIQTAITTLEGIAVHDGAEHPVFVRIGGVDGKIYIDLANDAWQVVEVSSTEWHVLDDAPVRFRRTSGTKALPVPTRGGAVALLRPLINVRDSDWPLLATWLVQAVRDRGPYPILMLYGEQGSAKSTATRLLRSIVDPSHAPLRSPPKELRDLAIAASNGWVVTLDNLSHLPQWLSDGLCVLSTGGGFATRTLYTDEEELIFSFRRPVIMNGITDVAERGDLVDRGIPITLEAIADEQRLTESEIDARFAALHPLVLGALLDAVSTALRREPTVHLATKSRMADFVTWGAAAEPALAIDEGDFTRAYARVRREAIEINIDTSSVGQWVRALAVKGGFTGTATELFDAADDKLRRASDWPKSSRGLAAELRRLAPALRAIGVNLDFRKEATRAARRLVVIPALEKVGDSASGASDASDMNPATGSGSDANGDLRTQQPMLSDADERDEQIQSDIADASDAKSRAPSEASSSCDLCGRRDLCPACKAATPATETCSEPGCTGEVSMFDASDLPWCDLHAGVGTTR